LAPIVAPQIDGQRGNSVLFDRSTFGNLRSLSGDVGEWTVSARYPITYLPWSDASILPDVDASEDYRRSQELIRGGDHEQETHF